MYRYELDKARRIVVLVIHGVQDGWEAKVMRIEWVNLQTKLSSDWSLIVDMQGYLRPQGDAVREQKKFTQLLRQAALKNKIMLTPVVSMDPTPFSEAGSLTVNTTFEEAWRHCGGEDRTIPVAPPSDGTRFQAINPIPPQG